MTWMVLLAMSSGLCWGTADFFGGLQSRRFPALAVALWSQIIGGIALLLATLLSGQPLIGGSLGWGIVSGLFGGTGLLLFYRALATGVMSLVAPISACGAIVPVVIATLNGDPPGIVPAAGIAVAIAGIILVSLQSETTAHHLRQPKQTIILSLGAALSFGLFFVFIDRGTAVSDAAALWVIVGARVGSLFLLTSMNAATKARATAIPASYLVPIGLIGILDTTANVLFAYASTQGNLGIVSVLGSLYPVTTVLLGRIILAERLSLVQHAGIVLALGGVALLSVG